MKKFVVLIVLILSTLFSIQSYALTPFWFNGIALDGSGQILDNSTVNVRITIYNGGTALGSQTFASKATDQFGSYAVEVDAAFIATVNADANTKIMAEVQVGTGAWVTSSVSNLAMIQMNTVVMPGNIAVPVNQIIMGDSFGNGEAVPVGGELSGSNIGSTARLIINNDAITNAKMDNDAIGTLEIQNDAVTPAKIEQGADNQFLVTTGLATTWQALNKNTTLVGNGVFQPLGLNTNNSNSWTADQLLPASANQGNNLISSVNAGSTTINTARLNAAVVLESEIPAAGDISGSYTAGFQIVADAVGPAELAATTVTLGSYGTSTLIPTFTVDADGRLTAAGTAAPDIATLMADLTFGNGIATFGTTYDGSVARTISVRLNGTTLLNDGAGAGLSLNLGNANTWSSVQSLQANATQGDNLIASVNAGTTTINTARLNSAVVLETENPSAGDISGSYTGSFQIVADAVGPTELAATAVTAGSYGSNLLIPTFTVDADGRLTAAGTTSPDIANLMADLTATNTTLTFSGPYDGSVARTVGLNLGNANTWTADQTFQNILPSATNTYSLGSNAIRWNELYVNGASIHIGVSGDEGTIGYNTATNFLTLGGNTSVSGYFEPLTGIRNPGGPYVLLDDDLALSGAITAVTNIYSSGGIIFSGAGSSITNTGGIVTLNDDVDITGHLTIGSDAADNITVNGEFVSNLMPNATNTYNIGAPGTVWANMYATTFTGALTGNASTATALQNPRDFSVSGDAATAAPVSFNGTANVSLAVTIANNAVTSAKINNGEIVNEDISNTANIAVNKIVSPGGASQFLVYNGFSNAWQALSIDATLTGNGVLANLGLNLTNSNTWTGIQFLPASTGQGNTIINAINTSGFTINTAQLNSAVVLETESPNVAGVISGSYTAGFQIVDGAVIPADLSAGTYAIDISGNAATVTNGVYTSRTISTTAPLSGGGDLSANRTLSISQAGVGTDGYLSTADWNTFNNKQPAGNYITALTGDVTATGPGSVAATVASVGGVTAANVASGANLANAATATNTLGTIVRRDASGNFTAGTITANLTGNVTGNASTATSLQTARDFSVSGDATTAAPVSFNGTANVDLAVTVGDDSHNHTASTLPAAIVYDTELAAWTGSTNITTLGTIATGTWQATPIADAYVPNNITIDLAAAATALQNARDFSVSGDAATAAAVSFNGTGNVNLAVTIQSGAGDNVNAAINNGATTTTINTNRLNSAVVLETESPAAGDVTGTFAAGLQVTDDSHNHADGTIANALTIAGGTVNSTPIGASTPSTGAFTTLNSTDLTVTNTIVGSINGNAGTVTNGVYTSRTISTTAPLSGGGNLSADRTLSISQANGTTDGYLSTGDWNTFNNKQPAGAYITALTGDVTAAGPGSAAAILATVNATTGTFGSATQVGQFTVNGKGLVTAASNVAIQITEAQVTNLTTDLAAKANLSGAAFTGAISATNLSGTNTGDQTSIVGITGTIAQFNTALTDGDFATGGGTATGTNTGDQTSIVGITGTIAQFNTALTDGDFATGGGTATGTNTGDQTSIVGITGTIAQFNTALTDGDFATGGGTATGTNTGDVTIGTANGLSLVGQALSLAAADGVTTGALTAADWTTFNGKEVPLTFSTGLTRTVNTVTVNTTQNITNLSNLATNGLVMTSGGTGALSIATAGTDYLAPFGSQTAATFYAAPSGAAGAPSFRTIAPSDVPTLNQNTTGNAATATTLQTARTINGVSFDGSANITVTAAAGTLTGTTLNATVTASSLTSVGTITSGVWNGTSIADANVDNNLTISAGNISNSPITMVYAADATGADFTIADGTGVIYITSGGTNDTWTATLPTGASNGQILYVYFVPNGTDSFTIGGTTYTTAQKLTFVFVNATWQLF